MSFFRKKTKAKEYSADVKTIKITVTDTDNSVRNIDVPIDPNEHLMHVLKENDFDVPGACGGLTSCGTCHIAVTSTHKLPTMDEEEEFMLDGLDNHQDNSRLSCQLYITEDLEGLELSVLGEE